MTKTLVYGIIALIIVIVAAFITFFLTSPNGGNGDQSGVQDFFGTLFPFGNNGDGQPLFNDDARPDGVRETVAPRLRQVSATPTSSGFVFDRDGAQIIRFIDRATGHVYETATENSTVTRITNTTVPGIQEVLWVNEDELIIRYLDGDGIETFFVSLDVEASGEQTFSGVFVDSFNRTAVDPETGTLFSVFEDENGADLVLSNTDGSDAQSILRSPIRSWVPLQSGDGVFVYSSPVANADGFLYQIVNGVLVKVFGNVPGLTAIVSSDGTSTLIGSGETDTINIALVSIETGEVFLSPIETLPAKCTFSSNKATLAYCAAPNTTPSGEYPNDWLLGQVSFSDTIWEIDFEEGIATFIADIEQEARQPIDLIHPMLSPNGEYLLFMNKNDLSLWSLRLEDAAVN